MVFDLLHLFHSMTQMDKKNMEKSKLLQECSYLTRLIQEHNNGKKIIGRALPKQGTNLYSNNTRSKYQKINTNKNYGSNLKIPISSNVLLKHKGSVHKTWINSSLSSSKPATSRDLKDPALISELPSTQKHCMYFNPNFLKTNFSGLDMTRQRLPKPKSNQNEKNLIHINPKALIHMVYTDLQKEENSNLHSERLVTGDISPKKHVLSHSYSYEGKMTTRSNSNSRKLVTVDVNAFKKQAPFHSATRVGEITGRDYSFCSDKKLVRNPLRHQYRVTGTTSIHSRNLQHPVKCVNTSPAHNRLLCSWECKAFRARRSVDIKAATNSPTNTFKCLGKSSRRNSFSGSRRRRTSSSSTSTVVKAAKLVCSKYKITRTTCRKKLTPNLRFCADSPSDKNIERLKKVKTYSLKYESAISRKNISVLQAHQRKMCTSGTYHNQNNSKRPFSSKGERNRKIRISRGAEQQRSKNGMHSISHLSLVRIGGVLYRSSKLKLARSITPKDKPGGACKALRHSQTKSGSNVHRCIVHVRGNAFLMDPTGKTLQRIRKNSSKPNVDIKNPSPLKRLDIGGVTYVQKSANVLIRTNTHKARSLLSQAKQRSIAMLTNKMRKSNQTCIFYHRFGKCSKLAKGICPHIHDPKQVAVCRKFLQGICDLKNCMLSHEVGPEKMPTCRYFLEGCCSKDSCPYLHVKVNPKAEICKNFLRGYCPEGQKCRKRHVYICPDFENGKCSNGKYCPYPHKNVEVGKSRIKKKTSINKSNLITKEKVAQKRYYQEEEQEGSLKLKETDLEVKAQEDLKEHKTDLEIKRIKILQKVDLMKSWQNTPTGRPVENMGNKNIEVSSNEFSSEFVVGRPKLGSLPAFIPIG